MSHLAFCTNDRTMSQVYSSDIEELLSSPPAWLEDKVVESAPENSVEAPLALQLLLGSLPEYAEPSHLPTSQGGQRKPVIYDLYEDLTTVGTSCREMLEKRKRQLEESGLPLSVLFCYHIPLNVTETELCTLLFDQLGILGVTHYRMEYSNSRRSRSCWLYFFSDEYCELAAFRLARFIEKGGSLPFEFSFSLPENDDVVQWKMQTTKKRKRTSKLQRSLATAHDLGVVSNTLFFDYIEPEIDLQKFREILTSATSGVVHVRITEPLLRKAPGNRNGNLIQTSRLGWATYASEALMLNALVRFKSFHPTKLGLGVPQMDKTASKHKQYPEFALSQRQKKSQISALKSGGEKITFIYEK